MSDLFTLDKPNPEKKKNLIFDMSNLLYRTFYANKSEDVTTLAGLTHHMALTTLNKYYKAFKPNNIVMCFDRPNWRKDYTTSEACISKKVYKGQRRKNMTPKEKEKYAKFLEHLSEFEDMMRNYSSSVVLAADKLEADDLIAGIVQVLSLEDDNEFIVVSGDKDLLQLLRYPNVTIINPATGKESTLKDWNNDAEYFIFEKCIRGDRGDNVQSAFPHVKTTRIQKAYTDPIEHTNLMHETWIDIDDREMSVKQLFKENQLLMDLQCQPDDIQKLIIRTVVEGIANRGNYSYFHFMKFIGKYELEKIKTQAEIFAKMMSC